MNGISDAINDALAAVLPSAVPDAVVDQFLDTDIGRIVLAANFAAIAPVRALYDIAYYLGYLPADLEATLESAIQDPSEIPGLASNLAYLLLAPTPWSLSTQPGLLGFLLGDVSDPLTALPGPIGELATNVFTSISDGINNLLSQLPTPISPTPFPSALAKAEVADVQVDVSSVPDASLAATNAITLSSTDPVDTVEKVAAPDSTEKTLPVTQQDPTPVADDVDQDATPPADKDATDVKPDKPSANPVKSGNKVRPGEKFGNKAKGETGKGETVKDETVKDETVKDTPSDGADPTGAPAGPNGGADDSDPGNASGAAA